MQKPNVVSQNMTNPINPLTFPLPNRDQYLHVFTYSPENLSISNFVNQLIFSILLHIHISNASNLLGLVSYLPSQRHVCFTVQ